MGFLDIFRLKSASPAAGMLQAPVAISNAQNRRMVQARFDNQLTTDENRALWAMSDLLSVDAAANMMVRRTLRMRARYAYHNNPYVIGPANRLAMYVIGPNGPQLHMQTDDPATNLKVEKAWTSWAKAIGYARKLRVRRAARYYNGEGFNVLRTNPMVRHPVKLDLQEIEADQVSSPLFGTFPAQYPDQLFDGLILDPWGNREVYHVLRQHPGAFGAFLVMGTEFDAVPGRYVLHDYGRFRPAQQRGIPEIAPALDLFEELRRYRKAVLAAAETAADLAGFIQTSGPADDGDDGGAAAADTGFGTQTDYVQIKRRQMGVLPEGWNAFQMKAEQPTTNYDAHTQSLLVEASQVLDMPLFILTGDARLANMSSAYVSTQSFDLKVQTDRQEEDILNDQTFGEWLQEARRIPGLIPRECPDEPEHSWRWQRNTKHADPQKVSAAMRTDLQNGKSPSVVFADAGLDFGEMIQRGADDYGVKPEELKAALFQSIFAQRGTPPPAADQPGTGDTKDRPGAGDEEDEDDA